MNTSVPWPGLAEAETRVLEMQAKLHNWVHTLVRRHLPGWRIHDAGIEMFRPRRIAIERYRYRGAKIPTPWASALYESAESRMR